MAVFDPRLDAQTLFGSGLKGEYLALLGGPFAAALVAKGVVSSKVSRGQLEKTSADAPSLLDVAAGDDGTLELADTQYLLFNLIAMGYVLATLLPHPARGLPAIPGTILGLTGASTLGYLGNKAFDSNVPLVASVIPAVAGIAEQVEIRGSNLLSAVGSGAGAATTVLFNGVASPAVEVAGNALKAVVPAGLAPGPADVTVVTPSGLSSLAKPIRVTEPAVPSGEGDGSDH